LLDKDTTVFLNNNTTGIDKVCTSKFCYYSVYQLFIAIFDENDVIMIMYMTVFSLRIH